MARRILVVDDEKLIVKAMKFNLEQENYEVDVAYDGETAVKMAGETEYSLILLDVMLPGFSGFETLSAIRKFSEVPIIMVTAKGEDEDKIYGLELGADDYITKPFNVAEVKARMKAIFRREAAGQERSVTEFKHKGLRVVYEEKNAYVDGRDAKLTATEFEILKLFIENPNKIFSREDILKNVWGEQGSYDQRTIDVHVRRLREKIEAEGEEPKYVLTKWGVGYYFKQD